MRREIHRKEEHSSFSTLLLLVKVSPVTRNYGIAEPGETLVKGCGHIPMQQDVRHVRIYEQ